MSDNIIAQLKSQSNEFPNHTINVDVYRFRLTPNNVKTIESKCEVVDLDELDDQKIANQDQNQADNQSNQSDESTVDNIDEDPDYDDSASCRKKTSGIKKTSAHCMKCDVSFKNIHGLRIHNGRRKHEVNTVRSRVRHQHNQANIIQCTICHKYVASTNHGLIIHMGKIHHISERCRIRERHEQRLQQQQKKHEQRQEKHELHYKQVLSAKCRFGCGKSFPENVMNDHIITCLHESGAFNIVADVVSTSRQKAI